MQNGYFLPIRTEHQTATIPQSEVTNPLPVAETPKNSVRTGRPHFVDACHPASVWADRRCDNRISLLNIAGVHIENLHRARRIVVIVGANCARRDQTAVVGWHEGGEEIPLRWNRAQTLSGIS